MSEYRGNGWRPSDQELRMRAAARVARRRSFMVSCVLIGSLIVLNLFFYAQSHRATWLVLDAVFAGSLIYRGWHAFSADRKEDERIRREVDRMRAASGWTEPSTPRSTGSAPPVPPPPPAWDPKS